MDFFMSIFPLFFAVIFCLIFGMLIYSLVQSAARTRKNNASPRVTAPATVVAKCTSVRMNNTADTMRHTYETHFLTFEFESGDRLELSVPAEIYGLTVEKDFGKLTFQGTRFLDFVRE